MRLRLLLPLLLLTACGSSTAGGEGSPDGAAGEDSLAGGGIARADNDLLVEIDLGDGSPPERWTLTCVGVVEGSHPQAEAACEHLKRLDQPFAPLPEDAVCTQQYGGPQTGRVTGVWGGEPVDLELSRTDGCRIAQWDGLVPLVPAAS
jgi:hypothetical protein